MDSSQQVYRSAILHFLQEPQDGQGHEYFEDGLLIVSAGRVVEVGPAAALLPKLSPEQPIQHYSNALIIPGFIDSHIHYPQIGVIASYGAQLLDWLNRYTFPAEARFADAEYARAEAERFLNELLRNGTTTALVYGTVHPQSVDAFFSAAEQRGLAMIAGKVMMDRHAPPQLCDTPESAYRDSKALIERWQGQGRLRYALTPRFAPTSTPEQLAKVGQLRREHPEVYLQTHLSENLNEVAWVQELFPEAQDYVDVYDRYGLVTPRSVFGHGIHLSPRELKRMGEAGAGIAFCPTSNLFLGSGLFDLQAAQAEGVPVSVATDVGGGTSFSMLQTLAEAYKVCQLKGLSLCPFKSFYMATLGNARALELDSEIGNFAVGKQADFLVLDLAATPLLQLRTERCQELSEILFALMILGDDRAVSATFASGRRLHQRDPQTNNHTTASGAVPA